MLFLALTEESNFGLRKAALSSGAHTFGSGCIQVTECQQCVT